MIERQMISHEINQMTGMPSHVAMEERLAVLLPPMYRTSYESVLPRSMGSAKLKYDAHGRVAWDQIWGSFCNLAMAGGPPHKGRLLRPGDAATVRANRDRYEEVTTEIKRGIRLAAGLPSTSVSAGWIRVHCANEAMSAWMLRAIVMENVCARGIGSCVEVPADTEFRLEKEIKNVITVVTKTAHYWQEHMPRKEQFAVSRLMTHMDAEQQLITTPFSHSRDDAQHHNLRVQISTYVQTQTKLESCGPDYDGWVGFRCSGIEHAVSTMRLILTCNVLARREEDIVYIPVNATLDPHGIIASHAFVHASQHSAARSG